MSRAAVVLAVTLLSAVLVSAAAPDSGVVGAWKQVDGVGVIEFSARGTVLISSREGTLTGRYRFIDGGTVRFDFDGVAAAFGPFILPATVGGDDLALSDDQGDVTRFQRTSNDVAARQVAENELGDAERARRTMTSMRAMATAVEAYHLDRGGFPKADTTAELAALVTPTYITSLPREDAWREPLRYRSDGQAYEIRSLGADRKADTTPPAGAVASYAADLVWSNGRFSQWPAGTVGAR
jgi:Type II secretion system (T2SS), protein G